MGGSMPICERVPKIDACLANSEILYSVMEANSPETMVVSS
jgi:uncharacterized protein YjaG (DUF416 family)